MIRVVIEHAPNLYALTYVGEHELQPVMMAAGSTYYRVKTFDHYVLYRTALSGWGAAAPNPDDGRPVFHPEQR